LHIPILSYPTKLTPSLCLDRASLCLCLTRGILKANWLPKHHSLIPAVVLVALPFKAGLTPNGYAQQEDAIVTQVCQLVLCAPCALPVG
jgi:hypothetical protein